MVVDGVDVVVVVGSMGNRPKIAGSVAAALAAASPIEAWRGRWKGYRVGPVPPAGLPHTFSITLDFFSTSLDSDSPHTTVQS